MNAEEKFKHDLKNTGTLASGINLARKHGTLIMDEANDSREAIVATAIMLSTFCAASGTKKEDMIELLKSVHAITTEFDGECK